MASKPVPSMSPAMLVDAFNQVVQAAMDYHVIREQELTKREGILAQRDVVLEQIRSNRAIVELVVQGTFDERAKALEQQFRALDQGLQAGNGDTIRLALDRIVDVIRTSPFKSVQEMRQVLSRPDFTLELE